MGAGPIGLRTALELALQGAQVPGEKLEGWKKIKSEKRVNFFQSISWAFDGCNIVYMQRIIGIEEVDSLREIIWWTLFVEVTNPVLVVLLWFCLEEGSGSSIDSWHVGSNIRLKLLQVHPSQSSKFRSLYRPSCWARSCLWACLLCLRRANGMEMIVRRPGGETSFAKFVAQMMMIRTIRNLIVASACARHARALFRQAPL